LDIKFTTDLSGIEITFSSAFSFTDTDLEAVS
jgi:hypothetical protein